jgi:peroxiredoxin family protein
VKPKHILIAVGATAGISATAYATGVGLGIITEVTFEKLAKRKREDAKFQTKGPKVEKIRSRRERKKTYEDFESIIKKY